MNDDWEDLEIENIVIPDLHVPNKEQIKRLEERKLIEESDNTLINELFDNKGNTESNINNVNNINDNKEINEKIKKKKKNPVSNQQENELKQKEFSQKLKQKKEAEKKHSDTFGEFIHHEYDKYDDKFD